MRAPCDHKSLANGDALSLRLERAKVIQEVSEYGFMYGFRAVTVPIFGGIPVAGWPRFGYGLEMERFERFRFSVPAVPLGRGSLCVSVQFHRGRFRFRARFLRKRFRRFRFPVPVSGSWATLQLRAQFTKHLRLEALLTGISLSKYGSEGFRVRLRSLSE